MTKMIQGSAATCDAETYAVEAAEADFILAVQCEIQKLLNTKGLRARDLSKRLNVTEARVSQMFGEQAKNLTLKTIARIFYHLGETAYITTQEEFDRAITSARGHLAIEDDQWTVSGIVDDLQVAPHIALGQVEADFGVPISRRFLDQWARAEQAEADKPRRFATAR